MKPNDVVEVIKDIVLNGRIIASRGEMYHVVNVMDNHDFTLDNLTHDVIPANKKNHVSVRIPSEETVVITSPPSVSTSKEDEELHRRIIQDSSLHEEVA